jgi:chorismate synthase
LEERLNFMGSIFGQNFKISVFGESHGPAIGVVIDGLPSGFTVDFDNISEEMIRRKPGSMPYSTKRNEPDNVEILSGIYGNKTTGTPLCAIITNKDQKSGDYDELKNLVRPGHADYSGYVRYKGFNDVRGSGHFSGRLTAPIVFAGALAAQILKSKGIIIGSHIDSIYNVKDLGFDKANITKDRLLELRKMDIPVNDKSCREKYLGIIDDAKKNLDSAGGIVETAIIGIQAGLGSPIFDNVEAKLSSILFSIPAVKGVEFGEGFGIASMLGSQANDSYYFENGKILTKTNNNGGINGGITNGMPIVFRVAVKPTSSIAKEQDTINIKEGINAKVKVKGRHDACIVPRVVPVIEASAAIAVFDLFIGQYGIESFMEESRDNG